MCKFWGINWNFIRRGGRKKHNEHNLHGLELPIYTDRKWGVKGNFMLVREISRNGHFVKMRAKQTTGKRNVRQTELKDFLLFEGLVYSLYCVVYSLFCTYPFPHFLKNTPKYHYCLVQHVYTWANGLYPVNGKTFRYLTHFWSFPTSVRCLGSSNCFKNFL